MLPSIIIKVLELKTLDEVNYIIQQQYLPDRCRTAMLW